MENRIAEIEDILETQSMCYLCDACVCPCEHYEELLVELARLKTDRFFARFTPEANWYVTGVEV